MGDCLVEMVVESLNIDENAEYSAKVEQGDMVEIGEKPELVGITKKGQRGSESEVEGGDKTGQKEEREAGGGFESEKREGKDREGDAAEMFDSEKNSEVV